MIYMYLFVLASDPQFASMLIRPAKHNFEMLLSNVQNRKWDLVILLGEMVRNINPIKIIDNIIV